MKALRCTPSSTAGSQHKLPADNPVHKPLLVQRSWGDPEADVLKIQMLMYRVSNAFKSNTLKVVQHRDQATCVVRTPKLSGGWRPNRETSQQWGPQRMWCTLRETTASFTQRDLVHASCAQHSGLYKSRFYWNITSPLRLVHKHLSIRSYSTWLPRQSR